MLDIYFLIQRSTAGSETLPFIQLVEYCFDDEPSLHVRQKGYLYKTCKFALAPYRRDVRILLRVPLTTLEDIFNIICVDETYEAVSAKLETLEHEAITRLEDAGLLPKHIRERDLTPTTVLTTWISNLKAGFGMRWDLCRCGVDDGWFKNGVEVAGVPAT